MSERGWQKCHGQRLMRVRATSNKTREEEKVNALKSGASDDYH